MSSIDRQCSAIVFFAPFKMLLRHRQLSIVKLGSNFCYSCSLSINSCYHRLQSKMMLAISYVNVFCLFFLKSGYLLVSNVSHHRPYGRLSRRLVQLGDIASHSLSSGIELIWHSLQNFSSLLMDLHFRS